MSWCWARATPRRPLRQSDSPPLRPDLPLHGRLPPHLSPCGVRSRRTYLRLSGSFSHNQPQRDDDGATHISTLTFLSSRTTSAAAALRAWLEPYACAPYASKSAI